MTKALAAQEVAARLEEALPGSVEEWRGHDLWVRPERIAEVARFLRDDHRLDLSYLRSITAVDYIEYFELVYHLLSLRHNHSLVMKARLYGREDLSAPSVVEVWKGADFQEREVWDLMGIRFEGHPNMKRILLWEGYPGHPLRKDNLE